MKRLFLLVILLIVGLSAPLFSAEPYAELSSLVKQKRFSDAFNLAESMSEQESGKIQFDMLYGIAALESKHPDTAVFAFERVLLRDPKNTRAQYEMGRALLQARDVRGAQIAFTRVLSQNPSNSLKQNTIAYLEMADKILGKQSGDKPIVSAAVQVGFNSNANGSSTEIDLLPPRGPVQSDGFANFVAFGVFQKKLSKTFGIEFRLSDVYRKNFSSSTYDYAVTSAGISYNWALGSAKITIPYIFTVNMVDYRPAFFANNVGALADFQLYETHSLGFGFNVTANHHMVAENNQISGKVHLNYTGLFLSKRLAIKSELFFNPAMIRGNDGIIGPAVRDQIGINNVLSFEFIKNHKAIMKADYSHLGYWMEPQDLSDRRSDNSISLHASYAYDLNSNWSLGATYNFIYKLSNKKEYTYARHEAFVGLAARY